MKKKKMFPKKVVVLILLFVIISTISTYIFYKNFVIFDVQETKMYLNVSNGTVGINVDTDALYFGKIPRGGIGTRNISLSNYDSNPHIIHIKLYGDFADWVYVSKNNFVIKPNSTEVVEVFVYVPNDAQIGNYTGTLRVEFLNKFF
jgi:hypothetical protein